MFRYRGQNLVNVKNKKVLDVSGNRDVEGQKVHLWRRHNGPNQRWRIVYLDKKGKEPTKGLWRNFGFYINRPFFIMSRMPMRRVIEVVGGRNLVIKNLVRSRRTQQWTFDWRSKTIKSVQYRGRSFDIQSSGRSANLQIYNTNSRWW